LNNPNIAECGVPYRFSSANQPKKRGRLPSKLKKYVKENAVSRSDLDHIFKNIIFGKTLNELQEMIKTENKGNLPLIVAGVVSSCIHDIQNGTMKEINNHIDRLWGKPIQQIGISTPHDDIPDDPEERRLLIQQIEQELALTGKKAVTAAPESKPKGE